MEFGEILNHLVHRSPRENYGRLKSKLLTGTSDFLYDLETVLRSPRHMDARIQIDRLFRYQRVIRNQLERDDLSFSGKRVLEIGCGPLLGWGPIAVYLGCQQYTCVEPRFQLNVLRSDQILDRYFQPMHQQLEAIYRGTMSFPEFKRRLLTDVEVVCTPMEQSELPSNSFDLIFSNGVLQHVRDLEDCVRRLRAAGRPTAEQLHVVNFTDHVSSPSNSFGQIYTKSPQAYFASSSLLNLKRPSEMVALFKKSGLDVVLVPYCIDRMLSSDGWHEHWRSFCKDDLAIQIAFLLSRQ